MSINHEHLKRVVAEMEQGVAATTQYSWLDLAKDNLRLHQEISKLRNSLVQIATDCAIMDSSEGKLAARVAQGAEEQLFRILTEGESNG